MVLSTMTSSDFSPGFLLDFTSSAYTSRFGGCVHRPSETSPVPSPTFTTSRSPYAGEFFAAALSGSSPLPWPSLSLKSSALPCSPFGANISTLQDSLYVTGCGFALLSQEDTTLQHLRSPRSTGCLLRGGLTLTATGLPPASRRQLSGHTNRLLGRAQRGPIVHR
jgi:hypothetical protein